MNREPTIMLIEDNPADVRLITELFSEIGTGCSFVVCRDGTEAESKFSNANDPDQAPHLIMLDINMPKMNGIEVLRWLKKNEFLKQVPVVIFSSSSSMRDIQISYKLGASSYVVKPFDFDEFNSALEQIWNYWFRTVALPIG